MTTAIYEMEPIGVDGAMEAVAEHIFCSETCASEALAKWGNDDIAYSAPRPTEPTMDGLLCENCCKPLGVR